MSREYIIDRSRCSDPEMCDYNCSHVWFTVKVIRGEFGDILAEFDTKNEAEAFISRCKETEV